MEIKKDNKILIIIISLIIGAVIMYGLFFLFPTQLSSVTNINRLDKEVTITDEGIADAVDKIYDSVVVVETFADGKIFSSGTGFVYKTDGDDAYIMTNNHVIEDGDEVYVNFTNDTRVKVEIMGGDKYADIAVLKVDADDIITVADMGSSEDARIGDTVFATGAPLDAAYSWSVTRGIVSGKDRMVEVSVDDNSTYIMKVIQTDAAINNGNSGGPLANSNGEVIGINSLKLIVDGVEGMGFAIPIEDALNFAEILETGKEIERPVLGINFYDYGYLLLDGAPSVDLPSDITYGIYVDSVDKNSSAEDGGIKKGDFIVEIENEKVMTQGVFRYYLYSKTAGETLSLSLYRDGKLMELEIKL